MNKKIPIVTMALGAAVAACLAAGVVKPIAVRASDHDDGVSEIKSPNLNLTDLFVFREKDQNPAITTSDLVFIMDVNPRSIAQQQYFFNTQARYQFNVTRVTDVNGRPSFTVKPNSDNANNVADVTLRFQFGAPAANGTQPITVTAIQDGTVSSATTTTGGSSILTTTLAGAATETLNTVSVGGQSLTVFAGLREDPFFFDVDQYFKVRASAAARLGGSSAPQVTFRPACPAAGCAIDSFMGYNVLSIVARVPMALLQGSTTATAFDVWETIHVPSNISVQAIRNS